MAGIKESSGAVSILGSYEHRSVYRFWWTLFRLSGGRIF